MFRDKYKIQNAKENIKQNKRLELSQRNDRREPLLCFHRAESLPVNVFIEMIKLNLDGSMLT